MEDVALVANFQFGAFPMTMLGAARSILRIDHAGELTARCIYEGQLSVLRIMDPKIVPLVEAMYEQEKNHLKAFDALIKQYDARPTALRQLCVAGGWLLGATTALMGRTTAMACTEAVETVVGGHYNAQLRELFTGIKDTTHKNNAATPAPYSQCSSIQSADQQKPVNDLRNLNEQVSNLTNRCRRSEASLLNEKETNDLISIIAKCRDEELEHLETALEHGARSSHTYRVTFPLIAYGVSAAIALARHF